jgi:hypothetical protein
MLLRGSDSGLWLVGTNGTAHLFPTATLPAPGHHSACHRWISTTLDKDEGPVKAWCPGCEWQKDNGLV